ACDFIVIDVGRIGVVGRFLLECNKIVARAGRPEATDEGPAAKSGVIVKDNAVGAIGGTSRRSKDGWHGSTWSMKIRPCPSAGCEPIFACGGTFSLPETDTPAPQRRLRS